MIHQSATARALATALSALAGFVDACGFMLLGGFFVSFMSGNTTRLAVGVAWHGADAALAGALILAFVGGVVLAALLADRAGRRRPVAVLGLLTVLLIIAAGLAEAGWMVAAGLAAAGAMGAENGVFVRDGEVQIGLTYMTGTLVKCGQRIAQALSGGDPGGWVPYALLWLGLATGGVIGAISFAAIGPAALWVAAGLAALMTAVVGRLPIP